MNYITGSSRKLERECSRNIELQWLLKQLRPNYHTIADFRKLHSKALQNMFRLYVHFLSDAGLVGKSNIAVDGSKFKAVNSKKNNYNQNKIDKHRRFIEEKTSRYLQQLDELDAQENTQADDVVVKKEKIAEGLQKLKERSIKYDDIQQAPDATTARHVSTTDLDSRSILVVKSIVEVAYNVKNTGEAYETSYRFKTYRTNACKTCPLKNQCTKLPKRIIHRSEYQDAVDTNNNNIKINPSITNSGKS